MDDRQFDFIDKIMKKFEDYGLPAYMWPGLERYLLRGIPGGGFLSAMLSNDLLRTFEQADDSNAAMMRQWMLFANNELPSICWGSQDHVASWVSNGGWIGLFSENSTRAIS